MVRLHIMVLEKAILSSLLTMKIQGIWLTWTPRTPLKTQATLLISVLHGKKAFNFTNNCCIIAVHKLNSTKHPQCNSCWLLIHRTKFLFSGFQLAIKESLHCIVTINYGNYTMIGWCLSNILLDSWPSFVVWQSSVTRSKKIMLKMRLTLMPTLMYHSQDTRDQNRCLHCNTVRESNQIESLIKSFFVDFSFFSSCRFHTGW